MNVPFVSFKPLEDEIHSEIVSAFEKVFKTVDILLVMSVRSLKKNLPLIVE